MGILPFAALFATLLLLTLSIMGWALMERRHAILTEAELSGSVTSGLQAPLDATDNASGNDSVTLEPLVPEALEQTPQDILQPWWREVKTLLAAWVIIAALGGVALRRHYVALDRRRQLAIEVQQRCAAQAASEQRELELRAVVSGIEALLFHFDHRGHIRFVHAPRAELLPAPAEELLGDHFRKWLPPAVGDQLERALEKLQAGAASEEVTYQLETDGTLRDFKALIRPLDTGDGHTSAVVLVTDITRERANDAQRRIAALAFETHLGMFITDAAGRVLKTNATFSRITGYSEDEVRGRNPSLWSSGRHDAHFYRRLWATLEKEGRWEGEIWNRRKNGQLYPQWLTISVVRSDDHDLLHYVATMSDLSEAKAAETTIQRLSFQDALTGLPNRRRLTERLNALDDVPPEQMCALLLLGMDHFQAYNNALGHAQGDLLLQRVADALHDAVDDRGMLARWDGDQFALLICELGASREEAQREIMQLGETLRLLVATTGSASDERPLPVAASIGATLFHPGNGSALESSHRAELAMSRAKREGGNRLRFFDAGMQTRMTERTLMQAELGQALKRHELELHYQMQVDTQGRITGFESLLRWRHGQRGMISPGEFIPLAEESMLILPIGHWVLKTACQQLAAWDDEAHLAPLTLAVNVSPVQFAQPDFVAEVERVLEESGADPKRLVLEVTEGLLLQDPQSVRRRMEALVALGVRFSIDDFGTGYSSLAYLKELPLHELKIDQAFVRDLLESSANAAIVKTIIALADALGLSVTAEGVETQAQRDWLQQHGCQHYQGYLFARPTPLAELPLAAPTA